MSYRHNKRPKDGDPLTPREVEVMPLVCEGLSNKEIAERIDISVHSVKFHVYNACLKLGAGSRTRAAVVFTLQQMKMKTITVSSTATPAPYNFDEERG